MTPEQARAIAAPQLDPAWNWPMSEDARKWVESVEAQQKPKHERQFDRAQHDLFMHSLG